MFVAHKPAEDFQQLCHSVEVLSFINEPEKHQKNETKRSLGRVLLLQVSLWLKKYNHTGNVMLVDK